MELVSNVSGVVISNISGVVLAIFAIIFVAIAILIPVWAYLAQKYARNCRDEIRELKESFQVMQADQGLRDRPGGDEITS